MLIFFLYFSIKTLLICFNIVKASEKVWTILTLLCRAGWKIHCNWSKKGEYILGIHGNKFLFSVERKRSELPG